MDEWTGDYFYEYFTGVSDPPEWMGFAMLRPDGAGLADEVTSPDSTSDSDLWPASPTSLKCPEYIDDEGRRWCYLSKGYEKSGWGGLVKLHGETSLVVRQRRLQGADNIPVSLDPNFTDQPYTQELYESACHLLGMGATWRLNTGNGCRRIRLHLVDWWRSRECGSRPMFEIRLCAGKHLRRHLVFAPELGTAKVQEFTVHVDDPSGHLEIEVKRCDGVLSHDSPPCFCGFEVLKCDSLQVPKENVQPGQQPHHIRNFLTKELEEIPKTICLSDRSSPTKARSKSRSRKETKVGYVRGFGNWLPST